MYVQLMTRIRVNYSMDHDLFKNKKKKKRIWRIIWEMMIIKIEFNWLEIKIK